MPVVTHPSAVVCPEEIVPGLATKTREGFPYCTVHDAREEELSFVQVREYVFDPVTLVEAAILVVADPASLPPVSNPTPEEVPEGQLHTTEISCPTSTLEGEHESAAEEVATEQSQPVIQLEEVSDPYTARQVPPEQELAAGWAG